MSEPFYSTQSPSYVRQPKKLKVTMSSDDCVVIDGQVIEIDDLFFDSDGGFNGYIIGDEVTFFILVDKDGAVTFHVHDFRGCEDEYGPGRRRDPQFFTSEKYYREVVWPSYRMMREDHEPWLGE